MKKTIILLKITLVLSVLLTGFTVNASIGINSKVVSAIFGTPPTSISGPSSACAGVRITLTAVGATLSSTDTYQWGTGTTIGSNIISGQTSASLSVTPLVTTTYWVRIIGTSSSTTGVTKVVTVVNPSTGPNAITGNLNTCIGSGTSLTATGATLASGAIYQWGTGTSIGSNIISGQTGSTLVVSPQSTTSYWVRCVDSGTCTNSSSGVSATVSVNTLNDDQTIFGNGNWIGYVYPNYTSTANPPTDVFETAYKGYVTTSGVNFDTNLGSGSISGANLCGTYSDYFGVKYRTTLSLTDGYYNFTVGGDDGYRLKIVNPNNPPVSDSDSIVINGWNDQVYTTQSKTIFLSAGTYNLTLEYYEKTGLSRVSFSYTPCSAPSTAPTSISGVTTICNGSSTTLTAVGANLNAGATYQWGNGPTIGNNIIAGQTSSSITVTPTGTTTYWVRVIDAAPCANTTSGISTVIMVVSPSTAPTSILGNTTVCLGSSTVLTSSGGNSATGVTYQWGTGSVVGSNIIAGQNLASITVAPITNTSYWVQKIDNAACTSSTSGISTLVSVTVPSGDQTTYGTNSWIGYVYSNHNTVSNPVTEDVFATNYRGFITQNETFDVTFPSCVISDANVCGTYNVKYAIRFKMNKTFAPGYYNFAIGGDDGVRLSVDGGSTYIINKWNVQAYTTGSATVYLNGNTNLVLEYFQGPLSGARVSFNYTTCSTSTAPTAIAGTTSTCSGSSTTLTATGGFEGVGSTYQWGTGSVIGSNIISGQTAASITVSPTNTTTYWVRRIDAAPCSLISAGITTTVTTTQKSTPPTWFSGSTSLCLGYGTTLSANSGTAMAGSTYQWGTGSVIGTNPIAGQTAQTLTVAPTTTTTYWVRRLDNGVCSAYTDGISVGVTVLVPPGDPNAFGNNQWNVYGYSTGDITLATALYAGNYSINSLNFDTQTGTNSWTNTTSPSASAGWAGCSVPNDNFTYVLKRKGFPCGNYTLKLLNWDDEARVYINGTQVWFSNTWSGSSATTAGATIGNYTLDSNSTIEVRVREYNGLSNVALTFTNNNTFVPSTDPTAISGTTTICGGSSTTLTATGGTLSTSGSYQWGTGSTIGTNIIAGQNGASITVSPSVDTTYWVRRVDTACSNITGGITQTVTVNTSVGGSLSANQNICSGLSASDITLSGNVGSIVKWQKATDSAFATSTDIANTSNTLSSSAIGSLSTTTYFRAVVSNASCSMAYSTVSAVIVAPASVGGTVTGSARVCSGSNSISLMLGGRVGSIIKWQSSTVSDFSSNVSDIANTTQSLTDSNLTTTTYYRAVVQNGMCSIAYSSTGTIIVDPVTVGGTVTGSKSYCASTTSNTSVLTLVGKTGSILKWQSSTTSDFSSNVIDIASNSVTLVVSNVTTTTYYRALVQSGVCSSAYSTIGSISIDALSVGGTVSGSSSVCPGSNSTTFTLTGNNGSIQWQSSTNNTTFTNIVGANGSTYTATNLMSTTYFRATSTNNTCGAATSNVGTVAVNAVSVAGTITGTNRVCSGNNSSTISLTGSNGNLQWQSSSDNSIFTNIAGATSSTFTATNLTSTTYYRVSVQNATCAPVYSGVVTITVDSPSVGGTVSGSTTVCTGTNSTTLSLSGFNGAIQWQSSTNNVNYTDISGATASTYTATNLVSNTFYRAVVTNGTCSSATSSIGVLRVSPLVIPGTISGATTVCSGTNATTLSLSGNTGATIQWQSSTNNSAFTTISGANASTFVASNLTSTTYYRVLVSNDICPAVASNSVTMNVDAPTVGGTVSGSTRYCLSNNLTTTLTLSNNVGSVVKWQSSTVSNFASNVQDITNTTTSLTISNLTTTTYFRAVVQNGTCNQAYSSTATITIDALSVGGSIAGSTMVCPNVNSTTLTLNGNLGTVVKWQSSTTNDFSSSVIDISNTTSTLVATNLTVKTYYRAVVANGTCSSANSGIATIDIRPLLGSIGEVSGATAVCGLSSATYSVAPVTNATDYIWTFPSGLSVYSSAGNSVVVNIDGTFSDGAITVKATNGCQVSDTKTIVLTRKPKVSTINGPYATCGITTGTYVANTITGATYNWSVPVGINITSGQGTSTIQVSYDSNYVTGTIGLTATTSCGVSDVLEYRVTSIQMPTIINGLAQIGSATTGTYTTPAVSGMGYVWSVPAGVSIVSGQNTNSVNLSFSSSFTMGTITVAMISSCGTSIPRTFDINRSQPIATIYGSQSLCGIAQITYDTVGTLVDYSNLFATYSVNPVADAIQYVWSVPQGATIVSGQGTNAIVMSFDMTTFINGNVTVTTMTQFGTGATKSIPVKRVSGSITGISNVCGLTTATYNIPATVGTNFTWTVPSFMTIVSGQGTNAISVSVGTPFANDNVKVNFVSNCGTNESFLLNVGCNKSTNVKDSQCGTTLINLDSSIYPNPVVGAQSYKYQVTNGTNVRIYEPTTTLFNLTQLPGGVTYNTTYSVQVAVKINGVWGGFGSACDITTPSPITKVKAQFCGTTLTTINTSIYADALIGAQGYRFEVTDANNVVRTFDSTTNLFNLSQLPGTVSYYATYSIRVAANVNGVWGAYGVSCNVSTPGVALTKVTDTQCGTTLINLNTSVYYVPVYAAQAYRFEVTNGTSVVTYDLTNTATLFNLTQIAGGAAYATTYSIRVASQVNGVWSAYGTACSITTPAAITKVKATMCGTTLATISTSIYADVLIGVQGYRFEVTDPNNVVRTYDATANLFNLTQLAGSANYGTTYSIRVAAKVNGVWGAYGASCTITTPTQTTAKGVVTEEVTAEPIAFTAKGYPNPFNNNFTIAVTSNNNQDIEITIYDMVGKMLTKKVVTNEDLNNTSLGDEFPAGVYNVIVTQGSDVKTLRMIKR